MAKKTLLGILAAASLAVWLPAQVGTWRAAKKGEGREVDQGLGQTQSPLVANITTITEDGGRLDWSASRNLITFDRMSETGYYDVWVMRSDGSDQHCLTCGKPGVPRKHKGNPAWHPSGRYIVFQAQNDYRGLGKITDYFANPGSGVNNDLWIMDSEGQRFWQLTYEPPRQGGVLHAHFSHNGEYLLWSERYSASGGKWGSWHMKIARFVDRDGVPSLTDERTLNPGAHKEFYETHGFTRDDRSILFSGNLEGQDMTDDDIYMLNLETNELRDLTNSPDEWDEHAQVSPSGQKIVWMTNRDLPKPRNPADVKSDYWIMNSNGSGQQRLTYFNSPNSPEYIPGGVACADSDWSPDGRRLAATLLQDVRHGKTRIVVITFRQPQ